MSNQYNYAGQSLVVDKITELNPSRELSKSTQILRNVISEVDRGKTEANLEQLTRNVESLDISIGRSARVIGAVMQTDGQEGVIVSAFVYDSSKQEALPSDHPAQCKVISPRGIITVDCMATSYNPKRITAPYGTGFIVLIPNDDLSVYYPHFLKMSPQTATMEWEEYDNTLPGDFVNVSQALVIGTFSYDTEGRQRGVEVYDKAKSLWDSQVSNIMKVMSETTFDDTTELNKLAKAMGVENVFAKIAVLEAFINKLFSNSITLMTGQKESGESTIGVFKSSELRYNQEDPQYLDYGFYMDASGILKFGNAYMRDIHLKCTDSNGAILLETKEYQPASQQYTIDPPSRWDGARLVEYILSHGYRTHGVYNGKPSRYIERSAYSEEVFRIETRLGNRLANGTLYTITVPGNYRFEMSMSNSSGDGTFYVTVNGKTVASSSIYDTKTSDILHPAIFRKTVHLNTGDNVRFFCTYDYASLSMSFYFNGYFCTAIDETETYIFEHDPVASLDSAWKKNIYDVFIPGEYIENRLVCENGFDSNDYLEYSSINPLFNNIPVGRQTDLEDSHVTVDGTEYEFISATRTNEKLILTDSDSNIHEFEGPSANDEFDVVGWYRISGSLKPIGQKTALRTFNLDSTDTNADIGSDSPYRNVYANNFFGNVNSEDSNFAVYGAVFG